MDRQMPQDNYTLSSSCEPACNDSSGGLKNCIYAFVVNQTKVFNIEGVTE